MDDLEPYAGYDDYDPGMTGSAMPGEYHGTSGAYSSKQDKNPPPLLTASTLDEGRRGEVDLLSHGFSGGDDYSTRYSWRTEIPVVAAWAEAGRMSIHPLVITARPPGITEDEWRGLDTDGIFTETYDPLSVPEVSIGPPEEREEPEAQPSTGEGGGDLTVYDGREGGGEDELDPTEMPFLDHLEEFRWALLKSIFAVAIAMIVSWVLSDHFYKTIIRLAENADMPIISTKLMEPIMLKLQMALVMGLLLALPFIFYFMWSFVSPGLYRREKKWILPLVFGASGCFFVGASIAYFIIIPFILPFIRAFLPEGITQMITIGDFVSKILRFTLLFGIVFEMPLVAYVLARIGILKHTWMSQYRKYAIVTIFIVGAVLTPPDPVSQVMMAMPLVLLYEISIVVARIGGRKTLI